MNITGTEYIQGNGFWLRPINEDDAEMIIAASLSDVPDWTYIPRNLDQASARAWIRRGFAARENGLAIRFVVQLENQLAGTIGAEHPFTHDGGIVEIFYFILPEFRRRGLATASLQLMNKWVQDVTPELRRLQLHIVVGNPGSGNVAKKAGYKFEGIVVNQIPAVNGYGSRDAEVYGIAIFGNNQSEVIGVLA